LSISIKTEVRVDVICAISRHVCWKDKTRWPTIALLQRMRIIYLSHHNGFSEPGTMTKAALQAGTTTVSIIITSLGEH
jgi:hypothetical protein